MRALPLLLLLAAALLAGCASSPSPVQDAEAAHAGVACQGGMFVGGFDAAGAPQCAAPAGMASTSCPKGAVVVGFDAGAPKCRNVLEVVAEANEGRAPPTPATPATPTRTMSLSSNSPLANNVKSYTVASATPGMTWSELDFALDGAPLTLDVDCTPESGEYAVCSNGALEADTATVNAGDALTVYSASSGATLRILDAQANRVILTLTVG